MGPLQQAPGRGDPQLGGAPPGHRTRARYRRPVSLDRAATPRSIDVGAIGRGALVATAVCLPLAVIGRLVAVDGVPPVPALLFLAVLVGFALGGFVAARASGALPYTDAALAALAAFIVIQGTAALVSVARGDTPSLPAIVFSAMLAIGAGVAGGLVAVRRTGRRA